MLPPNFGNKSSEFQRQMQPSGKDDNTHTHLEESVVLFPLHSLSHQRVFSIEIFFLLLKKKFLINHI